MDITAFVNDVIVGTADFFRDFLNTAATMLLSPRDILPVLENGGTADGIVPPVTFFVVSVIVLVLMAFATGALLTPSTKSTWLLKYLKETVRALAWKRLFLFAVPFLAVFTVLAASISLVSGWIAAPVSYKTALAICCYFGGSAYLFWSILLLVVLPQWAKGAAERFRPRWLWGATLGLVVCAASLRCMFSFAVLLDHFLDGSIYQTALVYGGGFTIMSAVLGLVVLWAMPFIERSTANLTDD
jgi:hypothetical protein